MQPADRDTSSVVQIGSRENTVIFEVLYFDSLYRLRSSGNKWTSKEFGLVCFEKSWIIWHFLNCAGELVMCRLSQLAANQRPFLKEDAVEALWSRMQNAPVKRMVLYRGWKFLTCFSLLCELQVSWLFFSDKIRCQGWYDNQIEEFIQWGTDEVGRPWWKVCAGTIEPGCKHTNMDTSSWRIDYIL
jgi:hypothetical protein